MWTPYGSTIDAAGRSTSAGLRDSMSRLDAFGSFTPTQGVRAR